MRGLIRLQASSVLASPWIDIPHLSLGDGHAREYVLVEENGLPRLRLDLCHAGPEAWSTAEAIWWRNQMVVGFAERLYFVDLPSLKFQRIELGEYFGHIHAGDDWLLVASGADITRFDGSGNIVWRSERLAIDGIVVHEITGDTISGEGEWNPPDGWRPFVISLADGTAARA